MVEQDIPREILNDPEELEAFRSIERLCKSDV